MNEIDVQEACARARMIASLVSGITGFKVQFAQIPTANINVKTKLVTVSTSWLSLSSDNLLAALLHECAGHGKRTDPACSNFASNAEAALTNVLEDVRIEMAVFNDWPGARRILAGLTDMVFDKWVQPDSPLAALIMACLYFGRGVMLGQQAPLKHLQSATRALETHIADCVWVEIQALILGIATMPSDTRGTHQCIDLARKILSTFSEARHDGKSGGKAGSKSEGESEGKSGGEADGKSEGAAPCNTDLGDLVSALCSDVSIDAASGKGLNAVSIKRKADHMNVAPDSWMQKMGAKAFTELGDVFCEMSTRAHTGYRRSGQRLNIDRAALAVTHDLEVFDTLSYGEGIDTAIAVSIDGSSSMHMDFRMSANATSTSPTLSIAAASLTAAVVAIAAEHEVPSYVNVFFDGQTGEVKAWDETLRPGQHMAIACGGTQLNIAIADALSAFGSRRESNKVYVILTDGDTSFSEACYDILTSQAITGAGIKLLFVQLSTHTSLGLRLEQAGHAVARADSYVELCSSVAVALKKLIRGVRIA